MSAQRKRVVDDDGFDHVWCAAAEEGLAGRQMSTAGAAIETVAGGSFVSGFELAVRFAAAHPALVKELERYVDSIDAETLILRRERLAVDVAILAGSRLELVN